MAGKTIHITIDQIFEGKMPSSNYGQNGQYLDAVAIDPDAPASDGTTDLKSSGFIRPVAYQKFSSTGLVAPPLWIITTPKGTTSYVHDNAGHIVSYDSALGTETALHTVSSSTGNGAEYYNNYMYYASGTDIGRYGPLDGSPSFVDNFWTSTLGLTALANTTYPNTRHSILYPNHVMKAHVDNKLYIADVIGGQGVLHFIKTKKVTAQGDTNDGSAYNALDLPFDYKPMCIESYGNNIAIGASFGNSSTVNQGDSALITYNPSNTNTFDSIIPVPDQVITALKFHNGVLYGWSGNLQGGTHFWYYVGGFTIQTIKYIPDAIPPLPGAIEIEANRIMWGGFTVYPIASASVFAYGSKSNLFPKGLHNIARSTVTATSSNGLVTALKNVLPNNKMTPNLVIGATDGTNFNLDKRSTTYQTSVWRSRVFQIGDNFTVKRINIPFAQAIGANMTIVPKLYFDNETSSAVGTTINSTNYSNSEKIALLGTSNFSEATSGSNSFFLEFTISGTALSTIALPIDIIIEVDAGN